MKAQGLRAPWYDRTGSFSWLRLASFALIVLPVVYIASQAWEIARFTRAVNATSVTVLFYSGTTAIWLLLAALSVTPLRRMLAWNRLIGVRRMLGLAAFIYTLLHIVSYVLMRGADFVFILNEVATRLTVIVALLASLCLAVLASTSTDAAIKRLGPTWNRIHKLAYLATALAILHYMMSPLAVGGEAYLMAGLFFWLMGWRLINTRRLGARPPALAALTLGTTLFSALFEAGMLWLLKGVPPMETLALNFSFAYGPTASFGVLVIGLAALAATVVSGMVKQGQAGTARR